MASYLAAGQAILGIVAIFFVSYLLSNNRKAINWRSAFTGLAMTVCVCLLILKVPFTRDVFTYLGLGINKLLDYSLEGASFVVGDKLAHGEFIFAIRIGSSIIFISMLSSLFYYLGWLQFVVKKIAYVLMRALGVSGPEALSTAAAVFVGQVECQVLIRPYIKTLSGSELFSSMAAAMATISGSALVAYTALGLPVPWLMAASIMSACGGLTIAKIIFPETNKRVLSGAVELAEEEGEKSVNAFDALTKGANTGWQITQQVMVMVLGALALIAMVNGILAAVLHFGGTPVQIQDILGYAFWPVAWLIGVPAHECVHVGRLMATEFLLNEYVSYGELSKVMQGTGAYTLGLKTQMIATVALCGFANLGSIGINIGGLSAMAPERRGEIAKMAFKALIAANLATHLSAAIVGLVS
jgi:CNT family concentrative nucleoside transporter